MAMTKERLARLRRRLENWPDDRPSPISINTGLELLDTIERLEKEADWLADKIANIVWTPAYCDPEDCLECRYGGFCANYWREAARRAVEEQCQE